MELLRTLSQKNFNISAQGVRILDPSFRNVIRFY
jgi:hypothetical protein